MPIMYTSVIVRNIWVWQNVLQTLYYIFAIPLDANSQVEQQLLYDYIIEETILFESSNCYHTIM